MRTTEYGKLIIAKSTKQELQELKSMAKLKRAAHRSDRRQVKQQLAALEDLDSQVFDLNPKFSY